MSIVQWQNFSKEIDPKCFRLHDRVLHTGTTVLLLEKSNTYKQTKDTQTQTHRQTDEQTHRHTDRYTETQKLTQTDTQTQTQTDTLTTETQ